MNTKLFVVGTVALGAVIGFGVYHWFNNETVDDKPSEPKHGETKMPTVEQTLNEQMLQSSLVMYNDLIQAYPNADERKEQIDALMVQLVYAHLNSRDCTDDVNRTYVDWVRKMHLTNPAHYESIIRRCADEKLTTMSQIRSVVSTHRTGLHTLTKNQVTVEVDDLAKYTSMADIAANKLDIPTDAYAIKVEYILDIPAQVILTGIENVVTLKEMV